MSAIQLLSILALLATGAVWANASEVPAPSTPPLRVDNFALLDQSGGFHELRDYRDRRALVLFIQGNGCPISRGVVPALAELQREFGPQGVAFLGLNASPQDDRKRIAAEAASFEIPFPVLVDETQLVAESLGVTRTAEVLLIDPTGWRIVYRGPVDDGRDLQTQRPVRETYLRDALRAHLGGDEIAVPAREAPGCLILLSDAEPVADFAEEIAPILERRCRSCHREGGVAPWAMSTYAMVRGWSPMMREMIRTRRMPPWHADAPATRFSNDVSMSPAEARTLVRWIEAGAPQAEGADPLAAHPRAAPPEWPLGPPDLVIEVPEQRVPARGVVDYRYVTVDVPAERDLWVRATDLRPSSAQVMHHGLAWIVYPSSVEAPDTQGRSFTEGMFAGYVPGREPKPAPSGTGYRLPAGSRVRFQLHYTTIGREETDRPRLGLYLADGPLAHELKTGAVARFDFVIPPGARAHREQAELELDRDILLYRLTPHMHYRGRSMRIHAVLPDGRIDPLLSVPRYDFLWQRQYVLAEPRHLPAGTRLRVEATFDNSEWNPANPDPTATVRYGEQSFEEMLFGYFVYRDFEEGVASRAPERTRER